jgi:hypothetical protein
MAEQWRAAAEADEHQPLATRVLEPDTNGSDPNVPLPLVAVVAPSFTRRIPSQAVVNLLRQYEDMPFTDLMQEQSGRVIAFRWLLKEYSRRDPSSLWMHSFHMEVEITDEVDPTSAPSPTPPPGSVATGTASPTTSTA